MNNLKAARKAKGMTQTAVAEYIGLAQSSYSAWESGKTKIDDASLSRLAELFEVSTDYLIGRVNTPDKQRVRIPVLGRVAAGIPIEAIEEIIDYEELDAAGYAEGEYFGLKIRGNSMEPRIRDGDVVIVRRQDDVDSGDVAIVLVNGDEGTCKRIKKSPQGVTLLSSNPAYEPMYFNNEEIERLPVKVIGRVVELRAKF